MNGYIAKDDLIELLSDMQGRCGTRAELRQNSKIWQQVKDMPTADVVPVSWIEAYAEELKDHDNSFNMMRYFTIIHMLADWKSEREEE